LLTTSDSGVPLEASEQEVNKKKRLRAKQEADNVVREAEVANPDSTDEKILGVRRMVDLMAAEPRVSATAIQTVGARSDDGFVLAVVNG
jgi:hypothetical protein